MILRWIRWTFWFEQDGISLLWNGSESGLGYARVFFVHCNVLIALLLLLYTLAT